MLINDKSSRFNYFIPHGMVLIRDVHGSGRVGLIPIIVCNPTSDILQIVDPTHSKNLWTRACWIYLVELNFVDVIDICGLSI